MAGGEIWTAKVSAAQDTPCLASQMEIFFAHSGFHSAQHAEHSTYRSQYRCACWASMSMCSSNLFAMSSLSSTVRELCGYSPLDEELHSHASSVSSIR